MTLHGQQQKQDYHDDPSSSELYVDFYKFRAKYPRDVLIIGMYGIAKGKQPMFVFLKPEKELKKEEGEIVEPKQQGEEKEAWYKRCFKSAHNQPPIIPYHRLIRVKGCGFLCDLASKYAEDPTRSAHGHLKTIQKSLCESYCYHDRFAYYITRYRNRRNDITVVEGKHFLNDDDSFEYLMSIIQSLQKYDIMGGGLTSQDIKYSPQHPIELIKRDENGIIVSGMESVIEAYYMREITLLGIFPYFTEEEEEEEEKKKKERILVCCVTNEEDGKECTLDRVYHPIDWIRANVYRKVSDYLKIKCDNNFIDSLLSNGNKIFENEAYIYSCTLNFENIQPVHLNHCPNHSHECRFFQRKLKTKILECQKMHNKNRKELLKRKMKELECGDGVDDLKDKKRFKKEDE